MLSVYVVKYNDERGYPIQKQVPINLHFLTLCFLSVRRIDMNKRNYLKKSWILPLLVLLLGISLVSAKDSVVSEPIHTSTEYSLPSPLSVNMILEESIFMRKTVRNFTEEQVTDEELSTVLWAAYGLRDDGKRSVAPIDDVHAVVIYVL